MMKRTAMAGSRRHRGQFLATETVPIILTKGLAVPSAEKR